MAPVSDKNPELSKSHKDPKFFMRSICLYLKISIQVNDFSYIWELLVILFKISLQLMAYIWKIYEKKICH